MQPALTASLLILLTIPARGAETEQGLLRRLDQPIDQSTLDHVAHELGQLGSAKGLERLLTPPNREAILQYEAGMTDWKRCYADGLPPDLEDVIVRHFDDPGVGLSLAQLVWGRSYHTRALFERFAARLRQPDLPGSQRSQFTAAARWADFPVEAEMLELFERVPAPRLAEPLSIQEVQQTRYQFYGFFSQHPYAPAVPAIRRALAGADRYEIPAACGALAKIGTPEAVEIAVEQVERLNGPMGDRQRAIRTAAELLTALGWLPVEAPVDLATLRRVLLEPPDLGLTRQYVGLIGHRDDVSALAELLLFLPDDEPLRRSAVDALLSLDSADAWRAADGELERLEREGKVRPDQYAFERHTLRERLADPEKALAAARAKRKDQQRRGKLERRYVPLHNRLEGLRRLADCDPERFIAESATALTLLEPVVAEYADAPTVDAVRRELWTEYLALGGMARFRLNDPRRALALYERSAGYQPAEALPLTAFAIADTWQYDLRDAKHAVAAYEMPLAALRARKQKGENLEWYEAVLDWWAKALEHQARFAATGTPFSGRMSREEAAGIYLVLIFGADPTTLYIPELRPFQTAGRLEALDRSEVARVLRGLPASQVLLLRTVPFLPLLSAAEIVDYLERADPGRYWAASLLTTAVLATSGPDSPSEFRLFPTHEEFAKIGGNPFPEAARRFMRRTGIVLDLE